MLMNCFSPQLNNALFPNFECWSACPLIAFALIRLHKLETGIRDVSTSNQNSQELQICGSFLLTATSLAPGSHQSCGMFGIAAAAPLKLRNDDSAPNSANQCNVAKTINLWICPPTFMGADRGVVPQPHPNSNPNCGLKIPWLRLDLECIALE